MISKFNSLSFKMKAYLIAFLCILVIGIILYPTFCRTILNNVDNIDYWDGSVSSSFAGGDGSTSNPYLINNGSEFVLFLNTYNESESIYFELISDIYLNDEVFLGINENGIYYKLNNDIVYYNENSSINNISSLNNFNGYLDGDNHSIYGLFIYDDSTSGNGSYLFDNVSGNINNVTFINSFIYSLSGNSYLFNNVSGNIDSLIYNGNIISNGYSSLFGNVVSSNLSKIGISGNINGNYSSGIISNGINSNISNSYNVSNVSGNKSSGIIFNANNVNVNSCFNSGNISSINQSSGIMLNELNSSINNSFNIGNIVVSSKDGVCSSILGNYDVSSEYLFDSNRFINNYYSNMNMNSVGNNNTLVVANYYNDILNHDFIVNTLLYSEYNSEDNSGLYIIDGVNIPYMYFDDRVKSNIKINISDKEYTDIKSEIVDIELDEPDSFNVSISDDSDILMISYYLDKGESNVIDINSISNWSIYSRSIFVNENGYYTLYIKVIDSYNNVSYASSDRFYFEGVNVVDMNNMVGKSYSTVYTTSVKDYDSDSLLSSYNNLITKNTKVKVNFSLNVSSSSSFYTNGEYYNIRFDDGLPCNTKIYMIDNINNKIYYYVTSKYTENLWLSSFYEVGKKDFSYFRNIPSDYYVNGYQTENFDFIFDFSESDIEASMEYSITVVLEVLDTDGHNKSDLASPVNNIINVAIGSGSILSGILFSTSYSSSINLSSVTPTNVPITSSNAYDTYSSYTIYDANKTSKSYYLDAYLVNDNGDVISGNIINSLTFTLDSTDYYSKNNGHVIIPWSSNTTSETKNITITPSYIVNELSNGTYYLKIDSFCSNCSTKTTVSNSITIPVSINNTTTNIDSTFDVEIPSNDRYIILDKDAFLNNTNIMTMSINYVGELSNPKVYVSLYKKYNYSAYNQTYELVDLDDYLDTSLSSTSISYVYELVDLIDHNNNEPITMEFDCSMFESGGYKLVFDLYDGNALIKSVGKTLVVK